MTILEFNNIYNKHWYTVFNFAKTRINSSDWFYAEEITSHVFIKLWQKQPEFENERYLKQWLYTSTQRKVIDTIRSQQLRPTTPLTWDINNWDSLDEEEISRLELEREIMQYVINVLKSYTDRENQIFRLHFLQGLSAGKIAKILKTGQQTVSNQLLTLKKKLRNDIKKPGHNPG